jgi:hypothetical protein
MGWLSSLGGAVMGGVRTITRNPITNAAASFIPGGGLIMKAASIATTGAGLLSIGSSLFGGGGSGAMPALPGMPGVAGQGPMGPAGALNPDPNAGRRSIFRDDPNVHAALKPYAIDNRFLKSMYRGPRGYVVLKDPNGDAYAIPKWLAKAYGMWRPKKKPPISVRQWQAMKRTRSTMKTLNKVEKVGRELARFSGGHKRPAQASYQVITGGRGDDVIVAPPKRAMISRRAA